MGLMIPSMLLKQLYTRDSLRNTAEGVRFSLKNRLSDSTVTALHGVKIDGVDVRGKRHYHRPGRRHEACSSPDCSEADRLPAAPQHRYRLCHPCPGEGHAQNRGQVRGDSVWPADTQSRRRRNRKKGRRRTHSARSQRRLWRGHRQAAAGVGRTIHRHKARAHLQLLVRTRDSQGQHRELHRRGAGPDRLCRARCPSTANTRRATSSCPWPPPKARSSPPTTAA